MNYLFFDIECANCFNGTGKICEFGYVKTDDAFNVLEEDSIKMNPMSPFDKKGFAIKGIEFDMPYDYYVMQPNFKEFYQKIKGLLCNPQNVVIGHGTKNDAKFLIDDCNRYHLPQLNFVFYDTQVLATFLYGRTKDLKLKNLYQDFCGKEQVEQKHQALQDAYMTLEIAKFYATDKKTSLGKILSAFSLAQFESFCGRVVEEGKPNLLYSAVDKLTSKNKQLIETFREQEMAYNSDTVYVFPKEWEKEHFKELIVILRQLKAKKKHLSFSLQTGATYVDFGEGRSRLFAYEKWCESIGREVKVRVIDFSAFLQEIELEEKDLHISAEELDEIIGNMECNRKWFTAYKKEHTLLYKINDTLQSEEFECGIDTPVIQYQTVVMVEQDDITRETPYCVYYDYLLNDFFHPHPYRVNRAANSYLPKSCFKLATMRSKEDLEYVIANRFVTKQGEKIKSIKIIKEYPYITSYKFKGKFNGDRLEFEFFNQILVDDDFKASMKVNLSSYKIDVEKALRELYDEKLFATALTAMAKFKFGYKEKDFTEPKIVNKIYKEGDKILLPKEYVLKRQSGELTEAYLPSLIKFKTALFKKEVVLPVLIERNKEGGNK